MRYSILCIISVCVLLFSCNNNKKKQTHIDAYLESVANYVDTLQEQTLGSFIEDQLVFYGNDSLKTFFLSSLDLEEVLFFHFSEKTCIPCINLTIEALGEYFPDYTHDENLIFISPDFPTRLRDDCYGKRLLTFYSKNIGLSIENLNVPFLFTVNENMEISSIHIVLKEDFKRTESYLKSFIDSNN